MFPTPFCLVGESFHSEKINTEIVTYALKQGGTSTGEHGIGYGKMQHLRKEHDDSLPFMRKIRELADPNGIMNPGKIFGEERR